MAGDSQLIGAIVVDDPRKPWNRETDRTFVFGEWDDVLDAKKNIDFNYVVLTINGLRYPATERLPYLRGTRVTWHIINASPEDHPLHLHGFYFDIASRGDGLQDVEYSARGYRERGVTELFRAGRTGTLTFDADRAGNWMFHCHIAYHIMRYLSLGPNAAIHEPSEDELDRHTAMGGRSFDSQSFRRRPIPPTILLPSHVASRCSLNGYRTQRRKPPPFVTKFATEMRPSMEPATSDR